MARGSVRVQTRRDVAALVLIVAAVSGANHAWQAWRARGDALLAPRLAATAVPGDILMFSSISCVYCERARRWLTEHRVPFDECFVERDADCAARYQALGAAGTPTLVVRGERQLGFDAAGVARALERPRAPPSARVSQAAPAAPGTAAYPVPSAELDVSVASPASPASSASPASPASPGSPASRAAPGPPASPRA